MNYLTAEEIIKINVMVIGRYSPKEPVGIADANSLQMIVEQAKQEIFGKKLDPDIYNKAAILWINLIKKHKDEYTIAVAKENGAMLAKVFNTLRYEVVLNINQY